LAHSPSAEKQHRQSLKRQARNRSVRSAARSQVARARALIEAGSLPEAEVAVRQATTALDRSQEKGIIHGNNAARRKSRLMARYNVALAAAAIAHAEAVQAVAPPPEEPVETGRRRRPSRKTAEKPVSAAAEKPAAKGRTRAAKAPAKKEDKAKKK